MSSHVLSALPDMLAWLVLHNGTLLRAPFSLGMDHIEDMTLLPLGSTWAHTKTVECMSSEPGLGKGVRTDMLFGNRRGYTMTPMHSGIEDGLDLALNPPEHTIFAKLVKLMLLCLPTGEAVEPGRAEQLLEALVLPGECHPLCGG